MINERELAAAIRELEEILGSRLSTHKSIREHHSRDESWHEAKLPDAVVLAQSTTDVCGALAICNKYRIPVTPFGTGTGVEGGVVAQAGGITIDVSGLNDILEVHAEDMDCRIQAGVTREQLNEHLRDTGLFFSVDPGANASLGGMAATRASGTNSVRYGTMRENVLSLVVVLADGSLVTTGGRSRKSAAGYDLTRLFIGSEGTLGIIVELTLKLQGRPEAVSAARVYFDDVDGAVDTAIASIQSGIPVARVELLDAMQMRAINEYSKTDYPEKVALFLEFHGSEASVAEQANRFGEICSDYGGSDFEWTSFEEERREMWDARHSAAYATMAIRPNAKVYATDVCVPISSLAACIRETREDVETNSELTTFCLGHIGDGNFHYVFLIDEDSSEEKRQVTEISERLVSRAIRMGGTCTGEHGIGIGKVKYLNEELGDNAVALMKSVKCAIDPAGILNPGKVLNCVGSEK